MPVGEFQRCQDALAEDIFVTTADHNYVVARWAFLHSLNRDFYWNATHAIEKYFKACLILNGRSSRRYKHNIVSLYEEVMQVASDLLPSVLICPNEINSEYFITQGMLEFLRRLNRLGEPSNRYAYYSYNQFPDDIVKIDAVVFSVRRITVALDLDIGTEAVPLTYRKWLLLDPAFQPRGPTPKLPKLDPARKQELEKALYDSNLAFQNGDGPREWRLGWTSQTSWLHSLVGDRFTRRPEMRRQIIEWIIENIEVSSSLKRELNAILALIHKP